MPEQGKYNGGQKLLFWGLVIGMLLITVTGWKGLMSVIDRGDKLANISQVITLIKDLRIARVTYDKDNGENGPDLVNDLQMVADASRLGHDMRFDIPTVGPVTIETCAECGIRQIALEAGKTILLERDRVAELCKRHKISLHAMDASGEGFPQPENPAQ